jgi:hypothetical protein
MSFKVLVVIVALVLCLLTLGCVQEYGSPQPKENYSAYTTTPTKNIAETVTTIKITTITTTSVPTPTTIVVTPETTTQRPQKLSNPELSLEIPPDTEYEWIDLNESLGTITINGTSYETGILGKMYVPREIELNRDYPIYILLSRNPEVSELALFGITLCISPSFVIDILQKRLDIYLHLGGGIALGKYCWDKWMKHWFITNIYSKSGVNVSCKIDKNLYAINLSELNPNEWRIYKITLTVKTPEESPNTALEQSLRSELSAMSKSYGGWWIPIQEDKIGLWIEKVDDGTYLAKLYMNEFDFRFCPGLGVVLPSREFWLHAGFGINSWDSYLKHWRLYPTPQKNQSLTFEKPSESSWKRIEVFKVRFDKLKLHTAHEETIENGNFEGIALSDENLVEWVYPQTLHCVKVKGTLTIDANYQKSINTTLYYTEKKGFKRGDKVIGFVKLVTVKTAHEPISYLSAIGDYYWIDKEIPPWITNVSVQITPIEQIPTTLVPTVQTITPEEQVVVPIS